MAALILPIPPPPPIPPKLENPLMYRYPMVTDVDFNIFCHLDFLVYFLCVFFERVQKNASPESSRRREV